jgi:hypothetical protein
MISPKPKPFIFVHIPKCAGTSIEQALIPIVTPHRGFKDLTQEARSQFWLPGRGLLQHSKIRRYGGVFPLDAYFKFAFVRNPWERVISQIEYLRSKGVPMFQRGELKEQIKRYCETEKWFLGHDVGACQLDYLQWPEGELAMDFVGRFENLLPDFATICGRLGIDPVPPLPHVFNSRRQHHYRDYYDGESRAWIAERFARDIDFFRYEF